MKTKLALILALLLVFTTVPFIASAEGMLEESFTLDCKVEKSTGEYAFDTTVQVNVALPADYNGNEDRYAVCYVLDGPNYISSSTDGIGLFASYASRSDMPDIIYVGVNYPEGSYRSAVYGAPFDTNFFLCDHNRAILDQRLQGMGDYYFGWIANTLKPYIDANYRTLADADHTGIIGYSSGGSGAMFAAMMYSDVFTKVGAFSPATWLWSNWTYGAVTNSGYHYNYTTADGAVRDYTVKVDNIKKLFVYQGGDDGSAGDPSWALSDVTNLYQLMVEKGAGSEGHRYEYYHEGTHSVDTWKLFNAECLKFLFGE